MKNLNDALQKITDSQSRDAVIIAEEVKIIKELAWLRLKRKYPEVFDIVVEAQGTVILNNVISDKGSQFNGYWRVEVHIFNRTIPFAMNISEFSYANPTSDRKLYFGLPDFEWSKLEKLIQ